jgi:hypothetical protein
MMIVSLPVHSFFLLQIPNRRVLHNIQLFLSAAEGNGASTTIHHGNHTGILQRCCENFTTKKVPNDESLAAFH